MGMGYKRILVNKEKKMITGLFTRTVMDGTSLYWRQAELNASDLLRAFFNYGSLGSFGWLTVYTIGFCCFSNESFQTQNLDSKEIL